MIVCSMTVFSHVLRDSTPHFVGPSLHSPVNPSVWSMTSLLLTKWSSDLKYSPCPPARNWGSRVSSLVLYKSQLNPSRGCQENWISFPRKALKSEFFFSISPLTTQCTPNIGSVPIRDSRVFNKPLGRSLHSFTRTAHSAHLLCSIRLASSTGSLTHFAHFAHPLHSLVEWLRFINVLIYT